MRLIAELRLLPTDAQHDLLLRTMRAFNAACDFAASRGIERGGFNRAVIHRLSYHEIRSRFNMPCRLTQRAIGKVVEIFRRDRKRRPQFRPLGAMVVCPRSMRRYGDAFSILTLTDRERIPFICGEYQRRLLDYAKGESDIIYRDGQFFVMLGVEVPEAGMIQVSDFIGVDMGVANIATTSDGTNYSGDVIELVRQRKFIRTRSLQRMTKRTKKRRTRRNARRALQYGRNRESRFKRDVNHCISKAIIREAQGTKRGVAIEDLNGIRARTRFRKGQRARMSGWAFGQLRTFIEYKGKLAGVPVVSVNPKNTSRTCSECGHCDEKNRPSQAEFRCLACGFAAHADSNAAQNIRAKALADAPQVAEQPHQSAA